MSADRAALLYRANSVHLQLPQKQCMRGRVGKQPGKNIIRRRRERIFADRINVATGGTTAETSARPLSLPRRPRAASEAANEALAGLFLGSSAKAPTPVRLRVSCLPAPGSAGVHYCHMRAERRFTLLQRWARSRALLCNVLHSKRLLRLAVCMHLPVVGVKCHEQNATRHGIFLRACVCNVGV